MIPEFDGKDNQQLPSYRLLIETHRLFAGVVWPIVLDEYMISRLPDGTYNAKNLRTDHHHTLSPESMLLFIPALGPGGLRKGRLIVKHEVWQSQLRTWKRSRNC